MVVTIPQIQIRQEYGRIGIDADLGTQEIRQHAPTMTIKTEPARLDIHSEPGELVIDQSKAWDALGVGSHLEMMSRIYTEAKNIGLQGIARIVERGNRLAAIQNKTNAIADIAQEEAFEEYDFNYFQPASIDNVDIYYTAHKPEIQFNQGGVDVNFQIQAPEINYNRGKLDIYMLQYPKLEIIPPQIDMKL
ncbi:MAG: DUF6470 family protein [Gorillibacterium sp.]|nr:DUF6470 family protein [Gorillibacterium sp.]